MSLFQNGTNCRLGRIVAWDELSLFGVWDELSLGTNHRLGRIIAWDELSLYENTRQGGYCGKLQTITQKCAQRTDPDFR